MRRILFTTMVTGLCLNLNLKPTLAQDADRIPPNIQTVLDHTQPLEHPRLNRLPLYVWPIHQALKGLPDTQARTILSQLDQRGIGYCVDWNHTPFEENVQEAIRIARIQQSLGMEISVNANICLYSLFDGTDETAHIDQHGQPFWDTSFGPKTGCPFALEHRVPVIRQRIKSFVEAYRDAGVEIDFIFADWEIDGPMEWNEAWEHSKRCVRCQQQLPDNHDFRTFQTILRRMRSDMQKHMFSTPVLDVFPRALVGNYAVHPHDGYRYWFDYFEKLPDAAPVIKEHKALYREWAPEFEASGYTLSMPVVYTWYGIFDSLPFEPSDYRWFYNMLKVASNAGAHTSTATPSVPFVHWHTTAPPDAPSDSVIQFSEGRYQDLLWHMLLRGHDSFFLWCLQKELPKEISLLHDVYADSMKYSDFIRNGSPIEQYVPGLPGTILSGLRKDDQVLVKRTDFTSHQGEINMNLSDNEWIRVPAGFQLGILPVMQRKSVTSWTDAHFPIGMYELPKTDLELRKMADAGINLVHANNRTDLDRLHAHGMKGWISLSVQDGLSSNLYEQTSSVWNHPALAVWEGPDEIIWTFTAYSFLKDRAGFTREDWENQKSIATQYAESVGTDLLYRMRQCIEWLKRNDPNHHPFWMNEAADSDAFYARGYMDPIDIIGCDYYAVRATGTDMQSSGRLVQRWDAIGQGRPVWMVLQGFSWHAIRPDREKLYPSFAQSRYLAYDAIVHGAKGILYWGTSTIDDPDFRQSLYALTSELSHIGPYLAAPIRRELPTQLIPDLFDPAGKGVKTLLCQLEDEQLLIVLNLDPHRHLAVEIGGLEALDGQRLHQLYGNEMQIPKRGNIITRLQAEEVKVFATDPTLAKGIREGRQYTD